MKKINKLVYIVYKTIRIFKIRNRKIKEVLYIRKILFGAKQINILNKNSFFEEIKQILHNHWAYWFKTASFSDIKVYIDEQRFIGFCKQMLSFNKISYKLDYIELEIY